MNPTQNSELQTGTGIHHRAAESTKFGMDLGLGSRVKVSAV